MDAAPPPKDRVRLWLGLSALGSYALLVVAATMWPTPLDQDFGSAIDKVLAVLHRNGVPEWFGYNKLEFAANVAMFIPLGFLAALVLPARVWWLALIICPALSVAIEITQAATLSARFATLSDVIANSLGALVGVIVAVALRALVYERDQKVIARGLWELEHAGLQR